ncbi:hypothetical protein BD311DRAFT_215501 [Dichomitus squalens]|uniref:Uncharacterized protein n=1 Tax=Dichomitus squalens TaxID=114155 RepID=A0A4Q9Q0Y3_9APHY|nr:hypothetical protein BD311DRAFT_215501 [Dichomitus squalens]TBU60476.1 hypothetical protein BD310DRAFT_318881 [Dichomitus squalens]
MCTRISMRLFRLFPLWLHSRRLPISVVVVVFQRCLAGTSLSITVSLSEPEAGMDAVFCLIAGGRVRRLQRLGEPDAWELARSRGRQFSVIGLSCSPRRPTFGSCPFLCPTTGPSSPVRQPATSASFAAQLSSHRFPSVPLR